MLYIVILFCEFNFKSHPVIWWYSHLDAYLEIVMLKRIIPILIFFAGFQANAALIEYEYLDTILGSSIDGLESGQSARITVALDNGGDSNVAQTWTAGDLQWLKFDFNNGALVTASYTPFDGGLIGQSGDFVTDGTGTLTSVMDSWWDTFVSADFTSTSGINSFSWYLNGFNSVYIHDNTGGPVGSGPTAALTNVAAMLGASNWSQVLPTAIPEPSVIALFGLGLVGLGFARRKTRS
jgi:hypothetical protein